MQTIHIKDYKLRASIKHGGLELDGNQFTLILADLYADYEDLSELDAVLAYAREFPFTLTDTDILRLAKRLAEMRKGLKAG